MNYFHQDWPLPADVAAKGEIGLGLLALGLSLVAFALIRIKS